jgi:hypothetical protein
MYYTLRRAEARSKPPAPISILLRNYGQRDHIQPFRAGAI